jgi:hypothetical protein
MFHGRMRETVAETPWLSRPVALWIIQGWGTATILYYFSKLSSYTILAEEHERNSPLLVYRHML